MKFGIVLATNSSYKITLFAKVVVGIIKYVHMAAGARHASDGGRVVGITGHCCWFLICGWRGWWRNEV